MNKDLLAVTDMLKELVEEPTVPRNVKAKFTDIISSLEASKEISIVVNKALHDLDEIGDDTNLQPYIRTQIWNLVSLLEKIKP